MTTSTATLSAPMSFIGSASRLWRLTEYGRPWGLLLTAPLVLVAIVAAWVVVLVWYCIFGIFLVPYRLVRRGQRRDKRHAREMEDLRRAISSRD